MVCVYAALHSFIICQFQLSFFCMVSRETLILQFWKALMSPPRYYVIPPYSSRPLDILGRNNHSAVVASKRANVVAGVESV